VRTIAKILVVEDNADIQSLLRDVLAPEFDVTAALDGLAALKCIGDTTFDLIILDLMLPGVTGESVLKQLRKISATPVLVLTAIQDKARTVSLLESGANDYLTKPFDIDELLARVRVQLRAAEGEWGAGARGAGAGTSAGSGASDGGAAAQDAADVICVGSVRMNVATHQVWVGDQEIALPKKEFSLLRVLMKRPKQVFAKSALYELVWGEPYVGAENALNVHLSNLRTKINEAASEPQKYVVAIWGIGVRFV
jgi:DNA-binding response OmpR family regulator